MQFETSGLRTLASGRAYVYLLPCREMDLQKLGYSRDPLKRLRSFHPRFYSFFDLDRGLLVETDTVREAKSLERTLLTCFRDQRAQAPLAVRSAADGRTEWHSGVWSDAHEALRREVELSHRVLHDPLKHWVRDRLQESSDRLYDWSQQILDAIEYQQCNAAVDSCVLPLERALREALAICDGVGMALSELVPARVQVWYERLRRL